MTGSTGNNEYRVSTKSQHAQSVRFLNISLSVWLKYKERLSKIVRVYQTEKDFKLCINKTSVQNVNEIKLIHPSRINLR